jgi:ketosteroid isomerase-like protein
MSDEVIRRRNLDQVHAFFRSERELNLEAWSAIWAENAIRRTPFAPPGFPRELQGKPAIVQALRGPFEQALRLTVQEEVFPTTDPRLVIARARTTGEMRNGATYENEVVAFFRFDDENRIVEWIGYINPLPILELMKVPASAAPIDNDVVGFDGSQMNATTDSGASYPYETHLDILYPPLTRIDLDSLIQAVRHPWYNQTLCQVNDSVVRPALKNEPARNR